MSRAILEELYAELVDEDHNDADDLTLAKGILKVSGVEIRGSDAYIIGRAVGLREIEPASEILPSPSPPSPVRLATPKRLDEATVSPPTTRASLSLYSANEYLSFLTQGQAVTPPTSLSVGLFVVLPQDDDGMEPSVGAGYSRVAIPCDGQGWSFPQNGETQNISKVTFSRARQLWGRIVGVGLWDQDENLRFYGPLRSSILIEEGDRYTIEPGDLTIRMRRQES